MSQSVRGLLIAVSNYREEKKGGEHVESGPTNGDPPDRSTLRMPLLVPERERLRWQPQK
jgi:hypothetical protein